MSGFSYSEFFRVPLIMIIAKYLIVSRDKINDDLEDKYGNKYSIDADALEYVCDMDYSPKKR